MDPHKIGRAAASDSSKKSRFYSSYARFGIASGSLENLSETTEESLIDLLSTAEKYVPKVACRLLPTSFDSENPNITAYPRSHSWKWDSLKVALRMFGSKSVISLLPLFWQIESPLSAVCRDGGTLLFMNDASNIPISTAAIRALGTDTILSTHEDAVSTASYLTEHPPNSHLSWVIVRQANEPSWNISKLMLQEGRNIIQEVHLFPGVPILEQCSLLMQDRPETFHTSDSYVWEIEDDKTLITSSTDDVFPLYRYVLPRPLSRQGICSCGKAIVGQNI